MAYGLDSAREQLQWQLIYAGKIYHSGLRVVPDRSYVFNQRSVPSLRTKTTKIDTTTGAQSVGIDQQAGTIEGESIFAQTGDVG